MPWRALPCGEWKGNANTGREKAVGDQGASADSERRAEWSQWPAGMSSTVVGTNPALSPDEATIAAIVGARHGDPFAVLGMHGGGAAPLSVRVFWPDAERVEVLDAATGERVAALEKRHPTGFFAGPVPGRTAPFSYRLRLTAGDATWEAEDPYRFPPILGSLDVHLMAEGSHRRIYERLGAHPTIVDGVAGVTFAVWAPNAQRVSVVGDFNQWDGRRHPMRKRVEVGSWEIFLPGVGKGERYKFELLPMKDGSPLLKADPLGFRHELPPATASVVHGLPIHEWHDAQWVEWRRGRQSATAPISIYEVHLGSWRRGDGNRFLTYDELADELIPYVQDLGFTHIECLPVSEHPFSGSWGYQPIGLFAPTARHGEPEGFARLVDRCHQAEIGVIVDWVPAHFPTDAHGLARFDGTALYEHDDPRLGFHQDWNTLIYNFGRTEVRNFLVANALYWLEYFHIDALRVDAVASMLYLDYSRMPGEWLPNKYGGRENLDAVTFLREMNVRVFGDNPGATTIAEESTAWPQVSRPVHLGGLGFGYKWNMGWMNDTLAYIEHEPIHRRYHHHQMTFGIHYAFTENFVLPVSHDEVVHGKTLAALEDARRPMAEIREPSRLSRLHVDASWQEASVHGERVRAGGRVEPRPVAPLAPARFRGAPERADARARPQPALSRGSRPARPRCRADRLRVDRRQRRGRQCLRLCAIRRSG